MMYKPLAIITNTTIPPRMILTVSDKNINLPKLDRAINPKVFSIVFPDPLSINTRNARIINPKARKYLTIISRVIQLFLGMYDAGIKRVCRRSFAKISFLSTCLQCKVHRLNQSQ